MSAVAVTLEVEVMVTAEDKVVVTVAAAEIADTPPLFSAVAAPMVAATAGDSAKIESSTIPVKQAIA
ncbi:MAG: hypothetical protein U0350_17330 [Caldilineaceae bacterium]